MGVYQGFKKKNGVMLMKFGTKEIARRVQGILVLVSRSNLFLSHGDGRGVNESFCWTRK